MKDEAHSQTPLMHEDAISQVPALRLLCKVGYTIAIETRQERSHVEIS